jgi:hypothetical protein
MIGMHGIDIENILKQVAALPNIGDLQTAPCRRSTQCDNVELKLLAATIAVSHWLLL